MPFSGFAFFASPLPHGQNVSLKDFFHPGKQTKHGALGEMGRIGRVGHWGHADYFNFIFLV